VGADTRAVVGDAYLDPSPSGYALGADLSPDPGVTRQVRDSLVQYASSGGVATPGAAWLVTAQAV
jgi:hypothetical protein